MKRIMLVMLMLVMAVSTVWAYDKMMAESYAQYFAPFSHQATGKALHMMSNGAFVEHAKAGELFILDIRAPGETNILGFNIPETVAIPMDQVFKPENLARLPTDMKIVVVCKAGHRAMAISTALRHIGFTNTYILKPGIQGLANYLSPKTAY